MARLSRAEIFDPSEIVAVHTMARTVRRCYLLGDDHLTQKNFDHRKNWFEDKLKQLASNFGIDLLAFSTSIWSSDQGLTSLLLGMIPRSLGVGGPFARNAKSSKRSMVNPLGFQPKRPNGISTRFARIPSYWPQFACV